MRYDVEERIRRIHREQHGVWTTAQARAAGVTASMTSDRVLRRAWQRLHPGVFAEAGWVPTFEGTALAAAWSLRDAVVSDGTAAELLRVPGHRRGPIETTVPKGRHRARPFIVHERTSLGRRERAVVGVVPTTTLARTLVDLSRSWRRDALFAAWSAVLQERRTTVAALQASALPAIGRGRPGSDLLRELLDAHRDDEPVPESVLEHRLVEIIELGGYGPAIGQFPLADLVDMAGRVDQHVPHAQLVLEADGRRWHTRVADFERDRRRDRLLQARGLTVMRFSNAELDRATGVLAEIDEHFRTKGFVRGADGRWSRPRAA